MINPKTSPNPQPVHLVPDFRTITMDQQIQARAEELARDMIRRGEFDHIREGLGGLGNDGDDPRRGQGHGFRGRGGYHGQPRQDERDRDRSLRYSIRDIPTFDGKGDLMPHTHFIEFEDFLMNTASEINDLHGELQEVDRPHYEAVVIDVVSKFKASLKGKPRLWSEM